jgi:branched-chain amino acid transport system permease protein
LSGLLVGAIAAAALGFLSGLVILRTRGLTLVMLTLAIATMVTQVANTSKSVTGGDDGLTGYSIQPVLGHFAFDLYGKTAYLYSLAVLAVVYAICILIVNSPFGMVMRGIHYNPVRMRLLGIKVNARLVALYTLAAALSGIAGAISAQVVGLVGLDSLAFSLSGNVLIMLLLGGIGRLTGAFFGAVILVVVSDRAAAIDPINWMFGLGMMLILAVRFAPNGVVGLIDSFNRRWLRARQ